MTSGIITVTGSEQALAEPTFIIKLEDAYYLTKAVWEYKLADVTTLEQEQGFQEIADKFAAGMPKLEAIQVPTGPDAHIKDASRSTKPGRGGG